MGLKFEISLCTINLNLSCVHYYVGPFISRQLCLIPRIFYTIACFIFIVYLLMVCAVEMITHEFLCATTKKFLGECNNRFVSEFGNVWKLNPDSTRRFLDAFAIDFKVYYIPKSPRIFFITILFCFHSGLVNIAISNETQHQMRETKEIFCAIYYKPAVGIEYTKILSLLGGHRAILNRRFDFFYCVNEKFSFL